MLLDVLEPVCERLSIMPLVMLSRCSKEYRVAVSHVISDLRSRLPIVYAGHFSGRVFQCRYGVYVYEKKGVLVFKYNLDFDDSSGRHRFACAFHLDETLDSRVHSILGELRDYYQCSLGHVLVDETDTSVMIKQAVVNPKGELTVRVISADRYARSVEDGVFYSFCERFDPYNSSAPIHGSARDDPELCEEMFDWVLHHINSNLELAWQARSPFHVSSDQFELGPAF